MFGVNDLDIVLYFVGEDEDDAQQNMPFDSRHSAKDYALDVYGVNDDTGMPNYKIYAASGKIDFTTMEEV